MCLSLVERQNIAKRKKIVAKLISTNSFFCVLEVIFCCGFQSFFIFLFFVVFFFAFRKPALPRKSIWIVFVFGVCKRYNDLMTRIKCNQSEYTHIAKERVNYASIRRAKANDWHNTHTNTSQLKLTIAFQNTWAADVHHINTTVFVEQSGGKPLKMR